MGRSIRPIGLGVVAAALALLTATSGGASAGAMPSPESLLAAGGTSSAAGSTGRALDAGLDRLPTATAKGLTPTRLAPGLVPPTNRWFSGLVFGAKPQPVFPQPLAFTPDSGGFTTNLPRVVATRDTIFGSAGAGLGLRLHTSGFRVSRYDALSVTATYRSAASPVADITLAEGWPYVAVTARRALSARLTAPVAPSGTAGVWTATVAGIRYAVSAPEGAVAGGTLTLAAGGTAVLFAVPAGAALGTLADGARGVVTGGTATRSVGARRVTTTLAYATRGGRPTVLAALPWQRAGGACSPGTGPNTGASTVPSIRGAMTLCTGRTLRFQVPKRRATATLDLGRLSRGQRTVLARRVAADVAATPAQPVDTYSAGKWLYRVANLLQLARSLHAARAASAARSTLDAALTQWANPTGCRTRALHCFVHDARTRGVVGRQPSFGSEQFNDHHFHYGYFLYAAAVAVHDRPRLKPAVEPVVDLLAADIGNPTASARFPADRAFDAYAGHSWASGTSPFADGNNQESSSEAVNAWNGLALWARATGDRALETHALGLLAVEARTAQAEWLAPDLRPFPGYRHSFVALNWGGKRDSATWFSADPAAKLGIQLIPMSPASHYTAASAGRMRTNLREARSAHTKLFADYLLMYQGLAGGSRSKLVAALRALPASAIDSADSKSYAEAYLRTMR